MPTPYESAQIVLRLYELRRDPALREARQWFLKEFTPRTFEELLAVVGGERNASFRMVVGYWDMACSFVTYGAVDHDIFRAGNLEIFATMSKIQPFLAQLRTVSGIPEFAEHAERFVLNTPGGPERLELLRGQFLAALPAS